MIIKTLGRIDSTIEGRFMKFIMRKFEIVMDGHLAKALKSENKHELPVIYEILMEYRQLLKDNNGWTIYREFLTFQHKIATTYGFTWIDTLYLCMIPYSTNLYVYSVQKDLTSVYRCKENVDDFDICDLKQTETAAVKVPIAILFNM